jgi:hypothetical protein
MAKKRVLPTITTQTGTVEAVSYDELKKTTPSDMDNPYTGVKHAQVRPLEPYEVDHDLCKAHVANAAYLFDHGPETEGMVKRSKCTIINEEGNDRISQHRSI